MILDKVDRVTWLREKDRVLRWREEVLLRKTDLECSERWFAYQATVWSDRIQKGKSLPKGSICYAQKQISMWRSLEGRTTQATLNTKAHCAVDTVESLLPS